MYKASIFTFVFVFAWHEGNVSTMEAIYIRILPEITRDLASPPPGNLLTDMIMRIREDDYILQSFAYLSICWRSELIDFSIKQGNGEKSTNKNKKLCHQFFSGTGGWNSDNSLIHKPLVVLKKKILWKKYVRKTIVWYFYALHGFSYLD